jgi:copper chaperone CopZ
VQYRVGVFGPFGIASILKDMQMQVTATKPSANHTYAIDGMSGEACVTKVTAALKSVPNVTTQSVKVGSAVVAADQHASDAACKAVTAAGFKCNEQAGTHQNKDASTKLRAEGTLGTESPQYVKPTGMPEMKSQHATGSATPISASQTPAERPEMTPPAKTIAPTM